MKCMVFVLCIICHICIYFFRRVREKLLHKLEMNASGQPTNLVKEFRRSAAGHDLIKPEELRTPEACMNSANYLIKG